MKIDELPADAFHTHPFEILPAENEAKLYYDPVVLLEKMKTRYSLSNIRDETNDLGLPSWDFTINGHKGSALEMEYDVEGALIVGGEASIIFEGIHWVFMTDFLQFFREAFPRNQTFTISVMDGERFAYDIEGTVAEAVNRFFTLPEGGPYQEEVLVPEGILDDWDKAPFDEVEWDPWFTVGAQNIALTPPLGHKFVFSFDQVMTVLQEKFEVHEGEWSDDETYGKIYRFDMKVYAGSPIAHTPRVKIRVEYNMAITLYGTNAILAIDIAAALLRAFPEVRNYFFSVNGSYPEPLDLSVDRDHAIGRLVLYI